MEIRQLEAFNAIVLSGSVTAAGHMLGRSQPVVSRQVSDLETELGFVLFERTRPAITLTQAGSEFYQEVRGVLADLQQLNERVEGMRSGKIHPMRILSSADLAASILPKALVQVEKNNPIFSHKLIVEEVVHETVYADLVDGGVEFAFINLPIEGDSLKVHWSGHAPCLLAVPDNHALAKQKNIKLDDIKHVSVITLLNRYRMRFNLVNSLVRATAGTQHRHIEVGSQTTAMAMVREGLGVALIDPFTITGALLDGIKLIPLESNVSYIVGVVSQAAHVVSNDAQRLITGLHSYVKKNIPNYKDYDLNA